MESGKINHTPIPRKYSPITMDSNGERYLIRLHGASYYFLFFFFFLFPRKLDRTNSKVQHKSNAKSEGIQLLKYKQQRDTYFIPSDMLYSMFLHTMVIYTISPTPPWPLWPLLGKTPHEGTLKWKSQEITNAKTIHASKKLRNRWPCQKFRDSEGVGTATAPAASSASFHCSVRSASVAPATLRAIDPQISHILHNKAPRQH